MGKEKNLFSPLSRAQKRRTYKTSRHIMEAGGKAGLKCPVLADCSNLFEIWK